MSETEKSPAISRLLGEMYGERATQAPFVAIASKRDLPDGTQRTLIGGIVLAGMCLSDEWERWRGSMILIPARVEVPINPTSERIDQMMLKWMNMPDEDDPDHAYWRETWRAGKSRNRHRG